MSDALTRRNRRLGWGLGLGLLAAVGVAVFSGDANAANPAITFPTVTGSAGRDLINELGEASKLQLPWRSFFAALAASETRGTFTSNVVLGAPGRYPAHSVPSPITERSGPAEAEAAEQAYTRGRDAGRYKGCPWPETAYTWGSGGWWSMLPSNAWDAYTGTTLRCRHPHYLLHPVDQFVCAVEYCRRIMSWKSFGASPTWLSLRVAWGNPSKIADASRRETTRAEFSAWLDDVDVPGTWLDQKVAPLPSWSVPDQWSALMNRFNFAPGHTGAF